MKRIIDIPKKIEEYIKDYIPIGAGDNGFCYPDEIVRMIQNGTPILDNATNEIEYYEKQIDKLETALTENIAVLDKYEEERKERDKGCVYCTTDRDGYITGFDKRGKYYISKDALGEPIFIIRGRELKQIPINFCPKCGRYLNSPYQKVR